MDKEIGIYIHIPFCLSKCYYCNFASYANKEDKIAEYTNAVCEEIIQSAEILSEYDITTIYIGGGTPSYIDAKYIKQIMDTLNLFVDREKLKEVTIELNPNSVTLEKLNTYKKVGINRLSIGLQSTHDDVLKTIGRIHKLEDFEKALDMANSVGFNNISLDLIYPLPNLDIERFKQSVDYVVSLKDKNIQHISIYNLEVHEETKLAFIINEGYVSIVDEDAEYEMYKYLRDTLISNGYERYEISNYAIPGYEAIHNTRYWKQDKYLGFGSNASSFFAGKRYSNVKDIDEYIDCINRQDTPVDLDSEEEMDKLALEKEYIMLLLRLTEGLDINAFYRKFKTDVYDLFKQKLDELESLGLIEKYEKQDNITNNKYIRLTSRGLEVANLVWEKFV